MFSGWHSKSKEANVDQVMAIFPQLCVMVRPWKAGNYLRNLVIGPFSYIRMAFVFGIIIKKRRARAASSDAITTLGIIKLFLLLRLRGQK